VFEAAVEHVGPWHAAPDRGQAGLHLGDHPGGQRREKPLELGRAELADDLGRGRPVPVEPLHVGKHDQLGGLESDRERGGRGVGVHVVYLAASPARDAGYYGDPAVGDQRVHRARVGRHDVADQADVHRLAVHDRDLALRGEQVRVLA